MDKYFLMWISIYFNNVFYILNICIFVYIKLKDYIMDNENTDFINATKFLKKENLKNNQNKKISDFWSNKTVQNLINFLYKKDGISPYKTFRGKGGGTYMNKELFSHFERWACKLPQQSITRNEIVFCDYIEESLDGVLSFERQKEIDGYFVDLYCEELSLCIEFDEKHHTKKRQVFLDAEREKKISKKNNVIFFRHKEGDNYSITINNIIRFKESYNIVQSIKNNTIPKKGFL